ncbi:hypothetical protein, partial [uncultured Ruminococcus sp.]|uniref:hypothetical protein n=1 Tax=uncultured Ruminococcus sp. TaxID=165186 RepID=UPI0025ED512A
SFPQREGRVWKRERERKPLEGERISSFDALSPLSRRLSLAHRKPLRVCPWVVSPSIGKPALRKNSTQII